MRVTQQRQIIPNPTPAPRLIEVNEEGDVVEEYFQAYLSSTADLEGASDGRLH